MRLTVWLCLSQLQLVVAKLEASEVSRCYPSPSSEIYSSYFRLAQSVAVTRLKYEGDEVIWETDHMRLIAASSFLYGTVLELREVVVPESPAPSIPIEKKVRIVAKKSNKTETIFATQNSGHFFSHSQPMGRVFMGKDAGQLSAYFRSRNVDGFTIHARALHLIIVDSFNTQLEEVAELLVYLWKRFQILNGIAHIPCSPLYRSIIAVYNPFLRDSKGGFGQVLLQPLSDIKQNPFLIRNSVTDLNGYGVRVSMFKRFPSAIDRLPLLLRNQGIYSKVNGPFYGTDGMVLHELKRFLNFTATMNMDQGWYGGVGKNGKLYGSLGLVATRNADLQANARYMQNYDVGCLEFTRFFTFDYLNVLVPKSEAVPKWLEIYRMFTQKVNIVAMAVWSLCCLLNLLMQPERGTVNAITDIYCMCIGQPQRALIRCKNISSRRIFLSGCHISFMILLPLFTAELIKAFTTEDWYAEINNLEELEDSGLTIKSSLNPFNHRSENLSQKLSRKVDQNWINISAIDLLVKTRKFAALERLMDAKLKIAATYTSDNKVPLVHIIPEYVSTFYMAYVVPRGSPYVLTINRVLTGITEAGLEKKWYEDFANALVAEARMRRKREIEEDNGPKQISTIDMRRLFYGLSTGYVLSIVVFIMELFWIKLKCSRNHCQTNKR